MARIQELSNERLLQLAPSIGAVAPYHTLSDRYSFVPTMEVVNLMRDNGWIPVQAEESRVRDENKNGFQKHMIRFTRPNALDMIVGDSRPDVVIYNDHSGAAAYLMLGGFFRLICGNGLVVGDLNLQFRHKHVGFDHEAFSSSAKEMGDHMLRLGGVIKDWQAIEMTPDERGVFAAAAHQLVYEEPDKAPIDPRQLLTARRWTEDGKRDLWTTFNTVQENVIRGGLSGRSASGRRTSTRPVQAIDRDRKLNQALWTLTSKMAELKNK